MSSAAQGADSPAGAGEWTFRAQLMFAVCALVLITGALVSWLAFRSAQASAESLADSLFREVSGHAVTHARAFVERAAPLVESLRQGAEESLALEDSDRLARQLLGNLNAHPGMSWISYGDSQGTFTGVYRTQEGTIRVNQSRIVDGKTQMIEHDVSPEGTWREHHREADSGYDPRQRPWYRKGAASKAVVWTPPYVFYNQGIPGISCAAGVFDRQGKVRGVFSVDFDLNGLSEFLGGLRVSPGSTLFLFTADEVLLAHPQQRVLTSEGGRAKGNLLKLDDVTDPLVVAFRNQLPEDRRTGKAETFRLFEIQHQGETYLASTTPFRLGDDLVWVVGAIAPKSDFLQGVWQTQGVAIVVSVLAVLLAVALAAGLARLVSQPVETLIAFMKRVGGGDLEAKAELGGGREFRELSAALNKMLEELRDGMRLRHSLNVAMEVQQRLLPSKPPQVEGLDIAGHSTYCDETGGDYYDFLCFDEAARGQLLVALGDVMGHGVAAALVMAGVRAVLRDRAFTSGSLAELMGRLNRMMASDLDGSRFMTMHLSIVDPRAGSIRWVSAGHDPAIIFDPATGAFEEDEAGDLPLGIMDDAEYCEHSYSSLRPGQVIVVGTDGIWEMPNGQGDMFGKDRLRDAIRDAADRPAKEIVALLLERLRSFRGECRPADDVTFVVLKIVKHD